MLAGILAPAWISGSRARIRCAPAIPKNSRIWIATSAVVSQGKRPSENARVKWIRAGA
jgi:hypothetical protein